jgi:hypothetical protein
MATASEILASANSVYQQEVALNNDVLAYRSELDALAAEDPCAPDFLDKLNQLTQKGELYTQKRSELLNQYRQLEKEYNDLSGLAKTFGDGPAAKDAIARLKAFLLQTSSASRAYNGPAKRKALQDANAKCSVEDKKTEKNEVPPEPDPNASGGIAAADGVGGTAITAGTTPPPAAPAQNSKPEDQQANNTPAPVVAQATGTAPPEKRTASEAKPTPRINPLSAFSSYTYSITLYMVTPEVMNSFINSGGSLSSIKNNPGVYIVAQSGGINDAYESRLLTTTGKLGLGEPGYDYYIDDLNIGTLLPGGTNRASVSTEIKFKIIEPQSYNFLTDINRASTLLNETSDMLKQSVVKGVAPNGFSQHYILGIKFYGYDVNGNVVTSESPEVSGYDNGDPASKFDKGAVINRYFAIKFTAVKFKLDGRAVNYNCEALVVSEQSAYGQINATIKNTFNLTGSTVGAVLDSDTDSSKPPGAKGLAQAVNGFVAEQKEIELISLASKIKIEFLDDSGKVTTTSDIAASTLIDDATFTNVTAPMSPANTTKQVTIADSFKAVSFDTTKKIISVVAGQNILNIIDNIIVKSSYVTGALKEITSQDIESETKDNPATQKLKWYTVNPVAKIINRDSRTNNWVYDITYQISPYAVPYIRSNLPGIRSKFPGPYKAYNYLLTGENSEIISYEQQYDNLYYMVASMSTTPDKATTGNTGTVPKGVQAASKHSDPTTGDQNNGSRLADDIRAQLYSPGDQSQAKIRILGDPDYIMTSTGVKATSFANKFYNKDSSINPQAGQVFINIIFNTASDYQPNGLLDVSDKLQFYRTNNVANVGIKGIIYMVVQVDSSFSRGTFSQTLDCLLVDESQLVTDNTERDKNQVGGGITSAAEEAEINRAIRASGTTVANTSPQSQQATTNSATPPTAAAASVPTDVRTSQTPIKPGLGSASAGRNPGNPTGLFRGKPVNNTGVQTKNETGANDDTNQPNNPSFLLGA